MGLKIIQSASFRSLLDELMGRVVRAAGSDPWTPRWVLTPTATVAARLRTRLVGEAGERSLGNLRVLPLSRLADRLCETLFGGADPRWSPFLDLLLLDLLENGPAEIVPDPLRKMPESYRLLVPTLLDLADGGFGPDQADPLLEVASEQDVGELTRRTLRFHAAWTRLLTTADYGWQPLQRARLIEWIQTASEPKLDRALGGEEGGRPEAFLYGFYDFTDLNIELIVALASRIVVEAYLPGADHAGFDFANAVCRDLAIRARDVDSIQLKSSDPVTEFLLNSFPPARPPEAPPAFLSRQRVSSRFAEALSAAVRVLTWCEGPEAMGPHEILIVAPDLEPYSADLRRAFEDFAIPLALVDLDDSQEGPARPLRMLRRIWDDRAPAEWVLTYLREYPELARRRKVDVDSFERKVRRLGLGGGFGWRTLREFAGSRSCFLEAAGVELTASEIRLVEEIVRAWVEGTRPDHPLELSSAAALLRLLSDWLPDPELLVPLTEELEAFGRVRPSTRLAPGRALDIALRTVSSEPRPGRVDGPAVVAASVMRARGLTARGIILLGLSADAFPRRVEEDTLLPDAARARLTGKAGVLGHRLPVKGRVLDEMALLFLLLNASAERVHWVIPETDEHGKAVAPTPWVQHYLQRWAPEDGPWRRIPRGPAEQARWLHRLDPEKGSFLPSAHAVFIGSRRDPPQEAPAARHQASDLGREQDATGRGISGSLVGARKRTVSVTRLERLARCPFRYWAEAGLRLRTLEPLTADGRLHPRERGSLLHECLEEITRSCREKGLPVSAAADSISSLWEERAGRAVRAQTAFLPPVLAGAVRWEAERTLRAYFRAIADGSCRDGVPLLTESSFTRRVEGIPLLTLTGKVDRMDLRGDGRNVVDYKSGRCPFDSKPAESPEFGLGFHLQPLLYPWLLEETQGTGRIRFSYVYLGGDRPKEVEIEVGTDPDEVLGGLFQLLETGAFVATSNEAFGSVGLSDARPCAGCDFVSLCRRFDAGDPARGLKSLRGLAPRRFHRILASGGNGGGL